jgi:hypothetical protein
MATKPTTSKPSDRTYQGLVDGISHLSTNGTRGANILRHVANFGISIVNSVPYALGQFRTTAVATHQALLKADAATMKYLSSQSNPGVPLRPVVAAKPTGHPSMNASSKLTSAPVSAPQPAIEEYTAAYKWNLPPHEWSLPFGPDQLQPDVVKPFANDVHSTRRGRIFYSQGFTGPSLTKDAGGNYVQDNLSDSYYGFQFMWNPDSFNQTTSVNMNVTPSDTDALANLTGFFAANSHLDFTIRLDRTNDFACFKAADLKYKAITTPNSVSAQKDVTDFIKFYQKGKPRLSDFDFSQNIESKIRNLLTYGTMSDLEFLYRTINGGGFSSFGVETSNIGYLRPTIVRVDLGPQKFLGVIGSLSLNHISFTKDMVPIRTDVNISIDLRALTSYSTNKSIGNSVPRSSAPGANR